jgi:hypothetical protein
MQQHWHGSGVASSFTNWRQGCQQQPPRDSRQQEVLSFCLQLHIGSSASHCVGSENMKGRFQLENIHIDRRDNIKMAITEIGWESVNWIHLAHIWSSDRLLWTQQWHFSLYKMRGISWLAEQLIDAQELSSVMSDVIFQPVQKLITPCRHRRLRLKQVTMKGLEYSVIILYIFLDQFSKNLCCWWLENLFG